MTDRMMPLNGGYGGDTRSNSTTPITNAGRVVNNAFIDQDEVHMRRKNVREDTAKYSGPTEDQHMSIMQYDLCFMKRVPFQRDHNRVRGTQMQVMSTLNGFGRKNRQLWQLINEIQFAGPATNTCKLDSHGVSGQTDVVVFRGGLVTITHTGPPTVYAGDRIMWSLPDPAQAAKFAFERNKGDQRILLQTMPYSPALDKLTGDVLREFIGDRANPTRGTYHTSDGPDKRMRECAQDFSRGIRQAMLMGIEMALRTGLVQYDARAVENTQDGYTRRKNNADNYYSLYSEDKRDKADDLFEMLSKQLRLMRKPSTNAADPFSVDMPCNVRADANDPRTARDMTLYEVARASILAVPSSKNDFIISRVDRATQAVRSGALGEMTNNQVTLLDNLYTAIVQANDFSARRIFGVALTPATQGQQFDILLGHYSV